MDLKENIGKEQTMFNWLFKTVNKSKPCVECVYCHTEKLPSNGCEPEYTEYFCRHPKYTNISFNEVTGKTTVYHPSCYVARLPLNCGPKGKYWERKSS